MRWHVGGWVLGGWTGGQDGGEGGSTMDENYLNMKLFLGERIFLLVLSAFARIYKFTKHYQFPLLNVINKTDDGK